MNGNGGDFELSCERAPVERLDILHHMLDLKTLKIDPSVSNRVKHKRVVGVRTVPKSDFHKKLFITQGVSKNKSWPKEKNCFPVPPGGQEHGIFAASRRKGLLKQQPEAI